MHASLNQFRLALCVLPFISACSKGGGADSSSASLFCGGSGTTQSPYQVCDVNSFNNISNFPSSAFILSADISLNGETLTQIPTFSGSITNPNGHAISGMVVASNPSQLQFNGAWIQSNQGTIDGLKFPDIKLTELTYDVALVNLNYGTLSNLTMNVSAVSQANNSARVAAIADQNESSGTISNVAVTVDAEVGCRVGAVAAENWGAISGATVTSSVLKSSKNSNQCATGGVVGITWSGSTVSNSTVNSTTVGGYYDVGGVVGNSQGGTITQATSSATVSGLSSVGGVVGGNGGTISTSYASGSVSATSDSVGGIAGSNSVGTIQKSAAIGNVSGTATNAGGLVGVMGGGTVSDSFAGGRVSGSSNVGGFTGNLSGVGTVTNCYSAGAPSGSSGIGGFAGIANTSGYTITSCYWDTQGSATGTSAACTGKTTAQMQTQGTFTGWNFSNTWKISSNQYPKLLWMP